MFIIKMGHAYALKCTEYLNSRFTKVTLFCIYSSLYVYVCKKTTNALLNINMYDICNSDIISHVKSALPN